MKKFICLLLALACILAMTGCASLDPRTVCGTMLGYNRNENVILMATDSSENYALLVGPDSTLEWEDTDFFLRYGLALPAENDWDYLDNIGNSMSITVKLGRKADSVSHPFEHIADHCYYVQHVLVETKDETMPEVTETKPVIYLYPETRTEFSVRLDYDGELTCTYPAYNGGWNVTAEPDGTLTDAGGQTYNYLYWEGKADAQYDFSRGFCVAGADTAAFLEEALAKLGLNRREANEFIVYWLPLMQDNPYNLIAFQSGVYTDHAKLTISPAPDTLIRVFMAWQPLESPVEIAPQDLTAPARTGFTAVEWGGAMIG